MTAAEQAAEAERQRIAAQAHQAREAGVMVQSSGRTAGVSMATGSDESDLVRAIRQSTQQSANQAGQQIVSKNLNIQPTITVRPDWPLRVIVHKDIQLRPWGGAR